MIPLLLLPIGCVLFPRVLLGIPEPPKREGSPVLKEEKVVPQPLSVKLNQVYVSSRPKRPVQPLGAQLSPLAPAPGPPQPIVDPSPVRERPGQPADKVLGPRPKMHLRRYLPLLLVPPLHLSWVAPHLAHLLHQPQVVRKAVEEKPESDCGLLPAVALSLPLLGVVALVLAAGEPSGKSTHEVPQALPGHRQVPLLCLHVLPPSRCSLQAAVGLQCLVDRVTGRRPLSHVPRLPVVVLPVFVQPLAVSPLVHQSAPHVKGPGHVTPLVFP